MASAKPFDLMQIEFDPDSNEYMVLAAYRHYGYPCATLEYRYSEYRDGFITTFPFVIASSRNPVLGHAVVLGCDFEVLWEGSDFLVSSGELLRRQTVTEDKFIADAGGWAEHPTNTSGINDVSEIPTTYKVTFADQNEDYHTVEVPLDVDVHLTVESWEEGDYKRFGWGHVKIGSRKYKRMKLVGTDGKTYWTGSRERVGTKFSFLGLFDWDFQKNMDMWSQNKDLIQENIDNFNKYRVEEAQAAAADAALQAAIERAKGDGTIAPDRPTAPVAENKTYELSVYGENFTKRSPAVMYHGHSVGLYAKHPQGTSHVEGIQVGSTLNVKQMRMLGYDTRGMSEGSLFRVISITKGVGSSGRINSTGSAKYVIKLTEQGTSVTIK